jgi:hypothetical protein
MPKFLYSIVFFLGVSWLATLGMFLFLNPGSYTHIFLFLLGLFFALSFTLSLPIYAVLKRRKPDFTNFKLLYKKAIKAGTFIAFGIVGVLFMRAFKLVNLLNLGLFLLLYFGIFYQIRSKK